MKLVDREGTIGKLVDLPRIPIWGSIRPPTPDSQPWADRRHFFAMPSARKNRRRGGGPTAQRPTTTGESTQTPQSPPLPANPADSSLPMCGTTCVSPPRDKNHPPHRSATYSRIRVQTACRKAAPCCPRWFSPCHTAIDSSSEPRTSSRTELQDANSLHHPTC